MAYNKVDSGFVMGSHGITITHIRDFYNPHVGFYLRQSMVMKKTKNIERVLADNITSLMEETSLSTAKKVSLKSGVGSGTVDRVKKAEVSTTIDTVAALADAFGTTPAKLLTPRNEIQAAQSGAELDDDLSIVITNALASMGHGIARPDIDMIVNTMRVTRTWLSLNLPSISSVNNLAIITASGQSMAPTFNDGDLLLVDRGVMDIRDDAVYVIARNNDLYVKRIKRRLQDGAVIVKSDNPLFGPDDIIENGERDGLEILGRIVWAWGGKRM